jgi:urocanate hydratase
MESTNNLVAQAMTIKMESELPDYPKFREDIRRAPDRGWTLTKKRNRARIEKCAPLHSRGTP